MLAAQDTQAKATIQLVAYPLSHKGHAIIQMVHIAQTDSMWNRKRVQNEVKECA